MFSVCSFDNAIKPVKAYATASITKACFLLFFTQDILDTPI